MQVTGDDGLTPFMAELMDVVDEVEARDGRPGLLMLLSSLKAFESHGK